MPDLKLVDLSWAGRLGTGHASIKAITAARVGDPVTLVQDGQTWLIRDRDNETLGRMSRAYTPPDGLSFVRGEIGAIVVWRKSDNEEDYRKYIKQDDWEAVLPELVFG